MDQEVHVMDIVRTCGSLIAYIIVQDVTTRNSLKETLTNFEEGGDGPLHFNPLVSGFDVSHILEPLQTLSKEHYLKVSYCRGRSTASYRCWKQYFCGALQPLTIRAMSH